MRLPLSRPLLYAFYALFSCAWLQGAALTQASVTNKELVVVGAIEQQQPDAEPSKNLLLSLPEDLYLVIGSFLSDHQLRRMLEVHKEFGVFRKALKSILRLVEWRGFRGDTAQLLVDGLEVWAQKECYIKNRKTLCIKSWDLEKEGNGALIHEPCVYVKSPVIQERLTKLVLIAPEHTPRSLDFLSNFSQLRELKLRFWSLDSSEGALDDIGQCTTLKTLALTLQNKYIGQSFPWGRRSPFVKNKHLAFLKECTQLKELSLSELCFINEEEARSFCNQIAQLINLTVLQLKSIYFHLDNKDPIKVCCVHSDWINWSVFKHVQELSLLRWSSPKIRHRAQEAPAEGLQSLAALSGCSQHIHRLDCTDCELLTDISLLTQCKQLTFVDLTGCKALQPASLAMLRALPKEVTVIVPQHCKELQMTNYEFRKRATQEDDEGIFLPRYSGYAAVSQKTGDGLLLRL